MTWARKRQLQEERATLWTEMKTILDSAENETRDLTPEETSNYNQHEARIGTIEGQLEVLESGEKLEARFTKTEDEIRQKAIITPIGDETRAEAEKRAEKEITEFRAFLMGEKRALQGDSDIEGGYLQAPPGVSAILLSSLKDLMFMRELAHVEEIIDSTGLGVVSLDTDFGDADWTAEITAATEDSALRVGRRALTPTPLTKLVKLSRTLVRKTRGGAENLVMDRLGYRFALTQEKGFLTGNGAGQPLGCFTASSQGISTSRDVSTDNTTTALTADGLINALYNLKGQYQNRATWIFHRDVVKAIRKLKDGDGQYLWSPGLGGQPSTILDRPFKMSENAPNTFTTGLYLGIVGDFDFYWILDVLGLEIQVLNELYALTNQFGYVGRVELDGMPVLEEAFSRVKLA